MSGKVTVELRPANKTDAPQIAAFHLQVWRMAYRDFVPDQIVEKLGYQTRLAYWISKLGTANSRQQTLLAIEDTFLVGFVCFGPSTNPEDPTKSEIKHLFIDLDHQGQGLGRRLLLTGFEHLHKAGFETARLAVTDANKPAIAFYHAMGGEITGQCTNPGPIWKSRDLIMSWPLPYKSPG